MAEKDYVRLNTRLYHGRDDDLIEWFNDLSYKKSDAVKAALRRGLGLTDEDRTETEAPAEHSVAGLDREVLAEIRRIVETAVESALQQHGAGAESMPSEPSESSPANDGSGDDEAEEILSRLDAGVTLD